MINTETKVSYPKMPYGKADFAWKMKGLFLVAHFLPPLHVKVTLHSAG